VSERGTANEIDFPCITEGYLQCMTSLERIVSWRQCKVKPLGFRVQKRQVLRIADENVDVVAFTVADLQYEGRAPTKCPFDLTLTTFTSLL
jgi:hypothetical protein